MTSTVGSYRGAAMARTVRSGRAGRDDENGPLRSRGLQRRARLVSREILTLDSATRLRARTTETWCHIAPVPATGEAPFTISSANSRDARARRKSGERA